MTSTVGPGGFLRGHRARYDVVDVAFVPPDVALLRKHVRPVDRDGAVLDVDRTMSALHVLTREQGG